MDELHAKVGNHVVTVRTLRVDGRNMTLQFFRQIPKEDWLDGDLKHRSDMLIWGRVSYRISGEGNEWLLVQVGDQLRRCPFDKPVPEGGLFRFFEQLVVAERKSFEELQRDLEEKGSKAASEQHQALRTIYEGDVKRLTRSLEDAKTNLVNANEVFQSANARRLEAQRRLERHGELLRRWR